MSFLLKCFFHYVETKPIQLMENESYIFNHFSDQYYEAHRKIFLEAPPPNPRYVLLAPLAHSPVINGELAGKIKSPVNPMKKKNTEV